MAQTYRELKKKLDELSEEQLDQNVTLYDHDDDEYYPVTVSVTTVDYTDVLDKGHAVLTITHPVTLGGSTMSIKETLQQIHDEADHITGSDRLIEEIVLEDAKAIKRLAKAALKELDVAKAPVTVKKWIATGELNEKNRKQADILDECGRLLDKSCSSEILGEVLFKGTDGKYYCICVEAIISEANPEYVKDFKKATNKEASHA